MSQNNIIETFLEHKVESKALDTHTPALLVGGGNQVLNLEKYGERPLAIEYEREFDDLRGFVDYVNDYKGEDTVCFAGDGRLTAYIDFHKKDAPSWSRHVVSYKIRRSNRWKIWENAHNSWMGQKEFSEFLDTGLNEIIEPTQSDILNLVKNFRATVNFDVDYEDVPGGTNFVYRKTVKSGSTKKETIEVPEYLTIQLQPFDNLTVINPRIKDTDKRIPAYSLRAKINWRADVGHADEQSIQFKVQVLNFENAVDETLEAIRVALSELTGVTTYIG
jgi:hypothetical protein